MNKDTYKNPGSADRETTVKVELDIADKTSEEVLAEVQRGVFVLASEHIFGARLEVEGEGYNVEHWLVGRRPATDDEIAATEALEADSRARRAARLRAELAEIERTENGA